MKSNENRLENKVYLETFGCQMNVSDSERVKTNLTAHGYQIVNSEALADVVLINTCSVREKAEQKLYHRIGRIRHARGADKQPTIGVMGCVAQLEGETLLGKPQKIDFVIGTKATGRIAEIVSRHALAQKRTVDLGEREAGYDWTVAPTARNSPYVAFVPIIEGCNKFCTYCIVPFSRGREESRPATEIINEIHSLHRQGIREIHLIGQNVNSYRPPSLEGLAEFRGATPFVKLLRAAAATRIERIKFTTSFPRDFQADIVAAINEHENLCNWVHLPVQSGSDRVLTRMRRGHPVKAYLKHIETIKNSRRPISLTSDIIVGFPGETKADFAATKLLVEQCQYDGLYIFKYSPRPGTPAATLPDDLSEDVKQERFLELEQTQRSVQKMVYERYLNRVLSVLAEKISPKKDSDLSGHSTCHKVVNFAAQGAQLGNILQVKITEAKLNSFYGTIIN
ncbi:MAG: tRNA (N6-isopentenyl adenosine(37)-C2)-methylthiotransferase MiaB [Pyrinomonadaceae bacterium]